MITRKPRKTRSTASANKVTSKKKEEINASLPVLSDENISCEDFLKIRESIESQEKIPRVVIPKIKIRCEPLNVEKVIDLVNNEVVHESTIKKTREKKRKKSETKKSRTKTANNKKAVENVTKESSPPPPNKKSAKQARKKLKGSSYAKNLGSTKEECESDDYRKKTKIRISLKNPRVERSSQSNLVASTPQKLEQSSSDMNIKTANTKVVSSFFSYMDDVSDIIELNEVSLEELAPFVEALGQEDLKIKLDETGNEKNKSLNNELFHDPNALLSCNGSAVTNDKTNTLHQGNQLLNGPNKMSLQVAVESFMNNPQLKYLRENTALKKGLCFSWLSNNYKCFNQQCLYSHNAVNLFTRKLKQYPSKFIITVVVSMRNDALFADVIMSALKILSERRIPVVWVTFLTFFVFYVTEPSDTRFLKFWANAARFFCQLSKNYSAASGFASLLSIFIQGEKSEEWKIIEFIKLIKQPPVQVSTTFALLQPVLKLDIPLQFLAEAVESCTAMQKDVLNVYSLIIPKISIMTSPIQIIELLLKFTQTLEQMNHKKYASDLRQRLRGKVQSFKTKINQNYPMTAAFQDEILLAANEESCTAITATIPKEKTKMDLENICTENNFFQLEDDFYGLMSQAMELSPITIPSPFRNTVKADGVVPTNNYMEADICERQVTRIRQFFRDCQFDLLGKYLNELRPNVVERAAEEFLKLLFQMKISLQQSVDLIKIIILPSKSENSAKVVASISVTLILNLVRINEWNKAFTILSLCREKEINILEGKVFYFNEFNTITQCRIILLFVEIYAYKGDYASAVDLIKKYFLFSSDNSLWHLTWKAYDETVRVRILEDLLQKIIYKQLTATAFNLFEMIWRDQKQLLGPVDLRKFINEILILLLNQNDEEAITLYDKIKAEVQLHDITVRAILVTLFRCNRLSAAKNLLLSPNQTAYFPLDLMFSSSVIRVLSFWLEEEIYVMFDCFFDYLVASKQASSLTLDCDFEIQIQVTKPNMDPISTFRPLCLGIINPTLKDTCTRIQRVLQYQFNPAVKLIVTPYCLKLDGQSLKFHLHKRMNKSLV